MNLPLPAGSPLTKEQETYLEGFFAGVRNRGQSFADIVPDPVTSGASERRKLTPEERIKKAMHPLDAYPALREDAKDNRAPDKDNVFRFKWNGLFWLAPVVDGYMCRLRIPGGVLTAVQWRELACIADELGSGFAQITTRNNVQLRVIQPKDTPELLRRIQSAGLHSRGAGADNLRNFTSNPTAGICPHELIDVLPFVKDLAQVIVGGSEFYDLPRKFNVSFDGGNLVGTAEDTNDLGFRAVRMAAPPPGHPLVGKLGSGVYFKVLLGGVTGHQEFARDAGILVRPEEAVDLAVAMIGVYRREGNRENRKKARLVYLLEEWGIDRFLQESEKGLGRPLLRISASDEGGLTEPHVCPDVPHPHLGVHPQKQPGMNYLGVHVPVGLIETGVMRAVAEIAENCGAGEVRLTVFQSLILPHVPDGKVDEAKEALRAAGLKCEASFIRGGLAACTGNRYCKYSSADTKGHALALASFLEQRVSLDHPVNIHVTGCPHSCAQHYIGDIGLLGCKVERNGETVEGFHVFVGGGFREHQRLGRQVFKGVAAGDELHRILLALLRCYLERRRLRERFQEFTIRQDADSLTAMVMERLRAETA